jgi:hypothetical protein
VHINDGKLYYYLMENGSGNALPLYLQVIDLGIVLDPFRVSLTSPFDGETYNVDDIVQVSADAIDENGSISKVEFLINGSYFGEDTTEPYSLDWTASTEGSFTFQAVAYNASSQTVSSNERTITVVTNDPTDLTGDIYRIKNFVTGKYMHSVGSDVVESDTGNNVSERDKEWEFVKAGDFYNIESKRPDRGILRAAGNPPNDIINTGFGAPREDTDKQFSVVYNPVDETYQFVTRSGSNYIYHNSNGVIEHISSSDDRSKWIVESTTSLSTDEKEFNTASIRVYPNPANNKFTIALKGLNKVDITIYNILGKPVYANSTNEGKIEIENDNRFQSGIYLIKVVDDYKRAYHSKLVIN